MCDSRDLSAAPSKREKDVVITSHAVARFRQRVAPWLSEAEARESLAAQLAGAHFVKDLPDGLEQWRGPKPWRVRLRVRRGSPLELVTVLTDCDARFRGKMPHGKASKRVEEWEVRRREEGRKG